METPNLSRQHPYFPIDLDLPHYEENTKDVLEILAIFGVVVVVTMTATWWYVSGIKRPKFSFLDKLKLCWFVSCVLIHIVIEGYFSLNHRTLAGSQTFLAQLWKEYGKSDSRYISSDNFTVSMETITAFVDGPLCLLTALAFIKNRPDRYVFQLIVSMMQLYGDVLYFMTECRDDFQHGELWHPLYFWFYFVFMNIWWIIVPILCIIQSYNRMCCAQNKTDAMVTKVSISSKKRH
ncbi:3-beta-hydroxysteroid-Delta(8),Delta(7)-isomerase-like [Lineus longissimus]|uniref:3-beta-hydroxysteroid-Delta(8), Delta(7)-isomerase-like n=1 Tax=Lineus longissimus TaxID=88925 RepID=UPI00315D284E